VSDAFDDLMVEAFTIYAASALAAGVFLRSMVATFLPLVGPTLNEKVGYGWLDLKYTLTNHQEQYNLVRCCTCLLASRLLHIRVLLSLKLTD
jgi:hypothetical protein